jgi:hypothetical protein
MLIVLLLLFTCVTCYIPAVMITDSDRNLWSAVMTLALADLTATKPLLERSARAWFLSSNRNPGSFNWVCDQLGLEPTAVKRAAKWKRR